MSLINSKKTFSMLVILLIVYMQMSTTTVVKAETLRSYNTSDINNTLSVRYTSLSYEITTVEEINTKTYNKDVETINNVITLLSDDFISTYDTLILNYLDEMKEGYIISLTFKVGNKFITKIVDMQFLELTSHLTNIYGIENLQNEYINSLELPDSHFRKYGFGFNTDFFTDNPISKAVSDVKESIENIVDNAGELIGDIYENGKDLIINVKDTLIEESNDLINDYNPYNHIKESAGAIYSSVPNLKESASDILDKTLKALEGVSANGIEVVNKVVGDGGINFVTQQSGRLADAISNAASKIKEGYEYVIENTPKAWSIVSDIGKDILDNTIESIVNPLASTWDAVKEGAKWVYETSPLDDIISFVGGIGSGGGNGDDDNPVNPDTNMSYNNNNGDIDMPDSHDTMNNTNYNESDPDSYQNDTDIDDGIFSRIFGFITNLVGGLAKALPIALIIIIIIFVLFSFRGQIYSKITNRN